MIDREQAEGGILVWLACFGISGESSLSSLLTRVAPPDRGSGDSANGTACSYLSPQSRPTLLFFCRLETGSRVVS